jgi:hypothetical protein
MQVTILEFIPNEKNNRVGNVDFKVTYPGEKTETFRNAAYFIKENRKWISLPMVERNGKWLSTYERTPPMKDLLNEVTKALGDYLATNNKGNVAQSGSIFESSK